MSTLVPFMSSKMTQASFLLAVVASNVPEYGWLGPLVGLLEARPGAGCAQPKLLMHPATELINTAGNRSHFLGFGFCGDYGQADRGQYDAPRPINYASGAAVAIRAALLAEHGLFEPAMYMYLEDAELSWRLRQMGHQSFLAPAARVYHKYSFATRYDYYYHLEKNRYWLLAVYYKLATLLLLLGPLALMELGQWCFALRRGLIGQKWRSWRFLLGWKNLRRLWRRRRAAQRRRTVSDRRFLKDFTGSIDFAELSSPLLKYLANPILRAYWFVARRLIFW